MNWQGYQSEHPAYLPAAGADFVASKIEAIAANPEVWAKTAVILGYDENDGIFAPGVPAYRYDPVRQVAVTLDDELWINSKKGKTWSSVAELDGDEGRSESWSWDDGKDVTEGW